VGKFGKEFNLANWRGIEKIAKLKIANLNLLLSTVRILDCLKLSHVVTYRLTAG